MDIYTIPLIGENQLLFTSRAYDCVSTVTQSTLTCPTYSTSTRSVKSEKCGRLPNLCKYDSITYNNKEYAVVTIQHKKEDVMFVIDAINIPKIINKPWHLSSGRYIATNYVLEDGTIKEIYLHNFLKENFTIIHGDEKDYVIHLNHNPLDNRMENLRIVDASEYNQGKSKKKRIVTLPEDSEINVDEIPKYVSYLKANGSHGDRFVIEIPKLSISKKLSSSKKISLKDKLQEAKDVLQQIYNENPEMNPLERNQLEESLLVSFYAILGLARLHIE